MVFTTGIVVNVVGAFDGFDKSDANILFFSRSFDGLSSVRLANGLSSESFDDRLRFGKSLP